MTDAANQLPLAGLAPSAAGILSTDWFCLSVRQPWAWLIMRPDLVTPEERDRARAYGLIKDIENRTWPTRVRGTIYLHAGKGMTRDEYEECEDFLTYRCIDLGRDLPCLSELQRGGIIGHTDIIGCVEGHDSDWAISPGFNFVLAKQTPLPFTPLRGELGFFKVRQNERGER
jgi:hypothetical protein